jgi:uncharacterized cupredoxin-like copper-binding protein
MALGRGARMTGCTAVLAAGVLPLSACGSSKTKTTAATASAVKTRAATSPAATATTAAAGDAKVTTTLSEYKIQTSPSSVAAGRLVFDVTNAGKLKHQFTIIRTDKAAAKVLSNQDPNDDIPGARGEISSIKPGASKTLIIRNLKPGHYALVCALPGHYQAGMFADFTVTG